MRSDLSTEQTHLRNKLGFFPPLSVGHKEPFQVAKGVSCGRGDAVTIIISHLIKQLTYVHCPCLHMIQDLPFSFYSGLLLDLPNLLT